MRLDEAEILTRDCPPRYLTAKKRFLKTFNFYDRRTYSKFVFLGPTLGPIYPLKDCEIEKSKYF